MPKRVSLKGRGADIFFGDYTADTPAAATTTSPAEAQQSDHESLQAGRQESKHARKRASKEARLPDTATTVTVPDSAADAPGEAIPAANVPAEIIAAAAKHVSERATVTNAFRYTDRELTWLADTLYDIGKRHRVKLSKQDVARFGLALILVDYEARGEASWLVTFAQTRKRPEVE